MVDAFMHGAHSQSLPSAWHSRTNSLAAASLSHQHADRRPTSRGGRGTTDRGLQLAQDVLNAADSSRRTALMHAAERGQSRTVRSLLLAGADRFPNDESGYTAMMLAYKGRPVGRLA